MLNNRLKNKHGQEQEHNKNENENVEEPRKEKMGRE